MPIHALAITLHVTIGSPSQIGTGTQHQVIIGNPNTKTATITFPNLQAATRFFDRVTSTMHKLTEERDSGEGDSKKENFTVFYFKSRDPHSFFIYIYHWKEHLIDRWNGSPHKFIFIRFDVGRGKLRKTCKEICPLFSLHKMHLIEGSMKQKMLSDLNVVT